MKIVIQEPNKCHLACLESICSDFYDQNNLLSCYNNIENLLSIFPASSNTTIISELKLTRGDSKSTEDIIGEYKENEKEIIVVLQKTADGVCFDELFKNKELSWTNHCVRLAKHESKNDFVLIMDPDPSNSIDKTFRKVFKREDNLKECSFHTMDIMRTRGTIFIEYYIVERVSRRNL